MSSLTKTTAAVLALASSTAFAGTMGPECVPTSLTVPCEAPAWSFGAKALYLQPIYGAEYAYYEALVVAPGQVAFQPAKNEWDLGFKVEGAWHFLTGNDINLNWSHLRADAGLRTIHTTTALGFPLDGSFSRDSHWDAVNVEMAQTMTFNERQYVRFYGGLQYAHIKTEDRQALVALMLIDPIFALNSQSDFSGFGPRVGADLTYPVGNGFSVYANPAAAVLVGTSKFINANDYLLGSRNFGTKRAMVPEIECKLGVNYDYGLAQGDLLVDVGYMWFDYFNAEHNLARSFGGIESDFSASGVYVGFVYKGYV